MNTNSKCLVIPIAFLAILMAGCVADPDYDIKDPDRIDTDLNVFENGIELPLGQTEPITVENALKMADSEDLDSFLKVDSDGNYAFSSEGEYNLDDVIADMHLDKLRSIGGISYSKDLEYKIGNFDQSQFKIEGKTFSYSSPKIIDMSLDDIPAPGFTSPDQVMKTELYKYLPDEQNLGKKTGSFEHSEGLLSVSELTIPESIPGDSEIPVQDALALIGKTSIDISYQNVLDDKLFFGVSSAEIAGIENFKLKSGGQLKVELEIQNCPLTGGRIIPDLDLDASSMLVLGATGSGSKLDLSGLELNSANAWKATCSYSISSFAAGFPKYSDGAINLKGSFDVSGKVIIQEAKSTPNVVKALSGKQMVLKAKISLDGVILEEMDVTLGSGIGYSVPDVVMPVDISYVLPKAVKSVGKVYFDQTKKIEVSISAAGLNKLKSSDGAKHISGVPEIEIQFPAGMEIAEAVNGKVSIKGEDLYGGNITRKFTLVSITPDNSSTNLTFKGDVVATVRAGISGTFSSKYLPASSADDVAVIAKIVCQPAIRDYEVTLDEAEIGKQVEETYEFSFEMEGMGDFGKFRIKPKNTSKAVLEFNLPTTTESDIIAENLVLTLPKTIVADGSGLSGFDASKNTLTINGQIPSRIEIPIKFLEVEPQAGEGDKTVVKGTVSISGKVSISNLNITRKSFDELYGKVITAGVTIPEMEAETIELDGDFSKSLDYDGEDIVFLDSKALSDIPEQVKSLDNITLDGVNALLEIKVTGLPKLDGKFVLKGTEIILPEFLIGDKGTSSLRLDDEIEVTEGAVISRKLSLTGLKDVKLEGVKEIKGKVSMTSTLFSSKPSVDISTLKSDLKVSIKIGVGNGSQAATPGKIVISKAVVKAGYDMEQKQSITFDNIPSELKGDGITLDLNPQMHLELKTNFGAPVKGDIILTPFAGGKALEPVTVKGIELPFSDDWNRTEVTRYAIGSNVTPEEGETLIAADLSSLLTRIPDSIEVSINVKVDDSKTCIIYPAADYVCGMKYVMKVPLSFGENFNFDQNADVEIDASVNDYLKYVEFAELDGICRSTLPVDAQLEVVLLDPQERVIELKEPAKIHIQKSTDGRTVKEGPLSLSLAFKNPGEVNLSTLRFKINIKASKDVNISKDQFLQISNLKLSLPKGIKFDFSK